MVLSVAVSDSIDGQIYLASGGSDYYLFVYILTMTGVRRLWNEKIAHKGAVTVVCFGHGVHTNLLFTGGQDSIVKVWNVQSGEVLGKLESHKERITSIATSPDGRFVSSGLLR